MQNNDKKKVLYDRLNKDGYDLGDYDSFTNSLNDESKRRNLYNAITKDEYDVGDYESFSRNLFPSKTNQITSPSINSTDRVNTQERTTLQGLVDGKNQKFIDPDQWHGLDNEVEALYPMSSQTLGKRINNESKSGRLDTIIKSDEEKRIDAKYTPRQVTKEADIIDNYRDRFNLTERGQELGNEYMKIKNSIIQKYADEFKNSKEYKDIVQNEPDHDKSERAINELFQQKYSPVLAKEMQPYDDALQEDMFNRYGYRIGEDLKGLGKKNTKEQVASLTEDINSLLNEKHSALNKHVGTGGNAMNALMASTHYNQTTGDQRREIGALDSAKKLLEQSDEIINEAGKKGKTSFFGGFGRGLRDNFDADKWTFGLAEMADAKYLNNALEKFEKGQKLNAAEEKLLEASSINMATQAYFGSDLGRGYNAGLNTAESLPFMFEFIINPISGSGNAIAKGLLKYGLKKFGRVATTKGTKFAGRLVGDAMDALGMESTTGIGRVASGTLKRLNENYDYNLNEDGSLKVQKNRNTGAGEAFVRSTASTFLENQSEMVFNAFRGWTPFMKATNDVLPGGVNEFMQRVIKSKPAQIYKELKNNPTFREAISRAQFHGLPEEYMEEVYNNFANVSMGEMSIEDALDLDNNINTFLSLAPTSVAFGLFGLGGLAYSSASNKRNINKVLEKSTDEQKRKFQELQQMSMEKDNDGVREFIKQTISNPDLTNEEKRNEIEFAYEIAKDNAIKDIAKADFESSFDNGYSLATPQEQNDAKNRLDYEAEQLKNVLGTEDAQQADQMLLSFGGNPSEVLRILQESGYSPNAVQTAVDYINAKATYDGMIQQVQDGIDGKITQSNVFIDSNTHEDNQLHPATMKVDDRQVYITSGNVVLNNDGSGIDHQNSDQTIVIRDAATSKIEMVSPEQFYSLQDSFDSAEQKIAAAECIRQEEAQQAANFIDGKLPFLPSDSYNIVDENGVQSQIQVLQDNGDGTVTVTNDGINPIVFTKDQVQQMADNTNILRLRQEMQRRDTERARQMESSQSATDQTVVQNRPLADEKRTSRPLYNLNDEIVLRTSNGNVRGSIVVEENEDGILEIYTESPINGNKINTFSKEELNSLVVDQGTSEEQKSTPIDTYVSGLSNEKIVSDIDSSQSGNNVSTEKQFNEDPYFIPSDEKGNPLYYKVPKEITIETINREGLESDEVDAFVSANKKSASKRLKSLQEKAPKMGTNIAKYKEAKQLWLDNVSDAQSQIDYWDEVAKEIRTLRERPGDSIAKELMSISEPLNGEELAAQQLGDGNIKLLQSSFVDETGFGKDEVKSYLGIFSGKDKEGVTIQDVGDILMQTDAENDTNLYDQSNPNAGRNDIIPERVSAGRSNVASDAEWKDSVQKVIHDFESKVPVHGAIWGIGTNSDLEELAVYNVGQSEITKLKKYFNDNETSAIYNDRIGGIFIFKNKIQSPDALKISLWHENTHFAIARGYISEKERLVASCQEYLIDQYPEIYSRLTELYHESVLPEECVAKLMELKLAEFGEDKMLTYNFAEDSDVSILFKNIIDIFKHGFKREYDNIRERDSSSEANARGTAIDEIVSRGSEVSHGARGGSQEYPILPMEERGSGQRDVQTRMAGRSGLLADVLESGQGGEATESSGIIRKKKTFVPSSRKDGEDLFSYAQNIEEERKRWDEECKVDTKPTDAQKEAGNYKKGHIKIDGYDITIENPKGSERSGVDENGKEWSVTMNNTYGYIRGTTGVDGDHIDVFLGNHSDSPTVYVVDQINPDGSFDEHKVMYGFNTAFEAKRAYMKNYSLGWKGFGTITGVTKDTFDKWIHSSCRKTKPFSEYKIAQSQSVNEEIPSKNQEIETSFPSENSRSNRLVTEERYENLKRRMQEKLHGQMNIGVDPEILAIGTEMAVYHIEKGARKFTDYAKEMINDLGDIIRPYLKSFYNGARDLPGMQELSRDMDTYNDVAVFDVANYGKESQDAFTVAEAVEKEHEIEKQIKKSRKNNSGFVSLSGNELSNQNIKEENGQERGSEEANSRLGETQREEVKGVQWRGVDRSHPGDIRPDKGRSGRLSDLSATESRRDVDPSEKKNLRNNRNGRGKDYAPTSPKARFDANIASIRLMRELTERTGIPTPAEMRALRRYSGWGGIGTFFNNAHSSEGQTLREILSEEEYEAAAMSINSAYYTPAVVTDSLWDVTEKLGFKGGTILEGSAGIGNILGAMPEGVSEKSVIEAVEIDSVSGNILKLLYPDAKIHVQGFQDTNIKNGSVDLAITNVPFVTGLHVYDKVDKDLSKKFKNIHDFCIAKNIRKLREGGIGIFITSNGTLDKSQTLREWIIGQGKTDVVGAFRLNNETFGGTNVTSDIIVVQKRVGNQYSAHAIDVLNTSVVRTGKYETGETHWDKKIGQYVKETKPVVMEYNSYFVQHPENMAGEMAFAYEKGDTFRPGSMGLYPIKGHNQQKMIQKWIESIPQIVGIRSVADLEQTAQRTETNEKEGILLLNKDGELCVSQRGEVIPIGMNKNKVKGYEKSECLNDYNSIKMALDEVLKYQVVNEDDDQLEPLLKKLNWAYDNFVAKYGSLNQNISISFLKNDVDFPSISALEDYREAKSIGGEKSVIATKTNVFNGRVIGYKAEPTPTTVKDGVIASVYKFGTIDLGFIASKLGKSEEQVKSEILNERVGFVNPTTGGMEVRYEYLSGNVREKLDLAKANNAEGEYLVNIEELEKVIPMDIPAHLIEFSLGSSWIDPLLYQQFLSDEFGVTDCNVEHVEGVWFMRLNGDRNAEKNRQSGVYSEVFGITVYGDELVSAALNNRGVAVKRIIRNNDGTTETVADKEASQACTTRIAEIKDAFKEWARGKMQQDDALAEKMMRVYNDKFNAIVPKGIDEMFLPERFGGAAESVNLYPHQKKSVIRGTTEPLMLAHEVGTGKTFTLISTAMEMRRIGTAKKPMIVVQNATVGQFVREAKKLYPNARILTLSDRDRTPEGRRSFYGKIKYSDWDMIVVPQSTFEMIPDSPERQMIFIRERIDDKIHALEAMRESGIDDQMIKNAERELDDLEVEFASVASGEVATKKDAKGKAKAADNASVKTREQLDRRTDDVQYFDEMGVDAILVDEAHEYKRLGFTTMMTRGVKGIDPAGSKKAAGVYLKTRAVLEQNGWKNVVFATGTPISNTAAEIWTFMKYLMPKEAMVANDIYYFDDFVRNFGNISQSLEFATNGKFKENTRFAAYINKPELVRLWASVSDTVLTKEVNYVNDKVPEMETGKAQDIFLPQSDGLIDIMRAVRKRLDEFEKMSGKEKRANSSIPLTMYGIAKRAAIDTRLVDINAIDDPNSKTNKVVEETLRSLKETDSYKGTVAIFCDNQRRWDGKVIGFDLFDDMKRKLVEKGVSQEQIVIMKSGMSIPQKEKIFADVNTGNVRVVIGNTQTLGTGVNIQERLHTLVHMDAPDRPMDYTQRNGRILRQGNLHRPWNKSVRVLRFGVEDSLDVTSYQRLKTKASFIDSIMDGKGVLENNQENRTLEEEEEGLFDNPVAVLSGSQYALLKNQAEREYRKYANKKVQYEADQIYITNRLRRNEGVIKANLELIEERKKLVKLINGLFPDGVVREVKIVGKLCRTDGEIDSALRELVNKPISEKVEAARKNAGYQDERLSVKLSLDGVDVNARVRISRESVYDNKIKSFRVVMHRDVSYSCETLGLKDISVSGGYVRNALDDLLENVIPGRDARESMDALVNANVKMMEENDLMRERNGKPFEYNRELKAAEEKVEECTDMMRKEMEGKEAKYADRGDFSDVSLSENAAAEEKEENLRYSNLASPTQGNISFTEKEGIIQDANELAERLHAPVFFIHDVNDITDENPRKQQQQRSASGWYDTKTDKVVIVLPNIHSRVDAQATVLHEVVAHKGLRQLVGKENFESFLMKTYRHADETTRNKIVALAAKYNWDFPLATEEYLAKLSEKGFAERENQSFWAQVRSAFMDMIHTAKIAIGIRINDNDLRYILWRSYQMQHNKGILGEAENTEMMRNLKVGIFNDQTANSDVRYRDSDRSINEGLARTLYERSTQQRAFRLREAYQDSMLGLRQLMEAISQETGKSISDHENAYMAENQMSSKNTYESEFIRVNYFKPIIKQVVRFMNRTNCSYDDIGNYLIAKHGLERNVELAFRDALADMKPEEGRQAYENYRSDFTRNQLKNEFEKGNISWDDYRQKDDELRDIYAPGYSEFRKKDYSGLRALTGENEIYENIACQMVQNVESGNENETTGLWKSIKAATQETLRKNYESGMMSKEQYNHVREMFEYYIPLRGWNEDVAADVYDYLTSDRSAFNSPIKDAKGRISLADDPLATIGSMAESAILQGNRNLMKQRFLNMVMNHPTSLATVSEMWYRNEGTEENPEWVEDVPKIHENATPDEISDILKQHEVEMQTLEKQGLSSRQRGQLKLNYRSSKRERSEHIVQVRRNGKEYLIYVNANPRAAQAVNGLTNPDATDHKFMKLIERLNRQMAANFTTRNPAFVVSNLSRDLIFSGTAVAMKENYRYTKKYTSNILKVVRAAKLPKLMWKFEHGTLDMNNETERYFLEFLKNGGETGYTNLHSVDEYKKLVAREIMNAQGKVDIGRIIGIKPGKLTTPTTLGIAPAFQAVAKWTEFANRCAEDTSRFTVYMTSRQAGRSVTRSISDAKEITVNFNKKGAGGLGATTFKSLYLFFNAAVQSLTNAVRLAKDHPLKFGVSISSFTAAGIILPMMNQILINAFGGDDDKDAYNNLPEWIRRNNAVFWLGGDRFLLIPLPIELRAFYGSGELFHSIANGTNHKNVTLQMLAQFSDLLPLDFTGNGGNTALNLIPDAAKPIVQVYTNVDYFGKPIYKNSDYNKLMPSWTKAYSGTSKQLVQSTELLNEITGGDKYMKGLVDLNPAIIEHYFEGYFGGLGKSINQLYKTISMAWDEDMKQVRNIPVVNRFLNISDERNAYSYVNEEYSHYLEEYKLTKQRLRGYENEADQGITDYAEKIDFLEHSPNYIRYEIMDDYKDDIKDYQDAIKEAETKEERTLLEFGLNKLKSNLVNELRKTEKK